AARARSPSRSRRATTRGPRSPRRAALSHGVAPPALRCFRRRLGPPSAPAQSTRSRVRPSAASHRVSDAMAEKQPVEDLGGVLELVGRELEVERRRRALHPGAADRAEIGAARHLLPVTHVHLLEVHVAGAQRVHLALSLVTNADVAPTRAEGIARNGVVLRGSGELPVVLPAGEIDAGEDDHPVGDRAHRLAGQALDIDAAMAALASIPLAADPARDDARAAVER